MPSPFADQGRGAADCKRMFWWKRVPAYVANRVATSTGIERIAIAIRDILCVCDVMRERRAVERSRVIKGFEWSRGGVR